MNCKGEGWKSWLMMAGCLLPIVILVAAPYLGFKGQYLTWLAPLACPLAMLFMMRMSKNGKCH